MSELSTLHAALTATIRDAIPQLASVDAYRQAGNIASLLAATHENEMKGSSDYLDEGEGFAVPALRHGIVRMRADAAPRDGRSVLITTFEAYITPDAASPNARLQSSVLAAQLMDLLRQQLWGLDFVEPSRKVRARFMGPGWRVRWEQPVLLGELQWHWPDQPPGSLLLGVSPDTGAGNQDRYVAPEDLT